MLVPYNGCASSMMYRSCFTAIIAGFLAKVKSGFEERKSEIEMSLRVANVRKNILNLSQNMLARLRLVVQCSPLVFLSLETKRVEHRQRDKTTVPSIFMFGSIFASLIL